MSNRIIVKFSFVAAMFIFASCYNEVPNLPSPDAIRYCKYETKDGSKCQNTYEIFRDEFKKNCNDVGGTLFCDKDCEGEPCE